MNKALFRYVMEKNGDNAKAIAAALGVHPASVYAKLNSNIVFSVAEIVKIKQRWNLSPDDVDKIFLN